MSLTQECPHCSEWQFGGLVCTNCGKNVLLSKEKRTDKFLKGLQLFPDSKISVLEFIDNIPDVVANHVLFHFSCGGYRAGDFNSLLIELIARADNQNFAKLFNSFPEYCVAVYLAQMTDNGVKYLQSQLERNEKKKSDNPEKGENEN